MSVAIQVLCEAYRRDPEAMHFLGESRVPCNGELAEYPYALVGSLTALYWH